MRILHVSDSFLPHMDGVIVSILEATKYQYEKGHKVMILVPKFKENNKVNLKGIKVHRFYSLPLPSYKWYRITLPHIPKLRKMIKTFNPDVMHIHSLPGVLALLALSIAKKERIPVVSTYHASFPDVLVYISPIRLLQLDKLFEKITSKSDNIPIILDNFEKNLTKIRNRFKKPIKIIEEKKDEFSRKNVWRLTKRAFGPSDVIIAPSKPIYRELKKYMIENKIKQISNGIDLSLFKKKNKYTRDFPKFLHVGRIGHEKKVEIVIKAISVAKESYPDITLTIVGHGPALNAMKELAKKFDVKKNVIFLGFKKREKLPEIYRKHDVFVTASEMETQGIVLIEAMASGLPVIGVNVLAIPEVVHNEKTGYLVRRGSSRQIANRMIEFIENPKTVETFGKNARKEAEKHDLKRVLYKLEGTYKSVIVKKFT